MKTKIQLSTTIAEAYFPKDFDLTKPVSINFINRQMRYMKDTLIYLARIANKVLQERK